MILKYYYYLKFENNSNHDYDIWHEPQDFETTKYFGSAIF